VDLRNEKISRKVAESEQKKIPFAFVIGGKEVENDSVAVRKHGEGDLGAMRVADMLAMCERLNVPEA
ncbi:MAG: His/Gly/Thr/Pro-type tRNA ligase C-terminal domain-containing protein, partial [Candidatus Kapabacteria bacterium]|nr:His/Gly/Thr/Pro-type tRNA ligase C-terminal domain-containing protein [Candidatus Kapabacteria bacterium]